MFYNKPIYTIHYPYKNDFLISYGILKELDLNNNIINHTCSTNNGSSGAPLLLLESLKVIGIHTGSSYRFSFNLGIFIKNVISEFFKITQKKDLSINEKKNNIYKIKSGLAKKYEISNKNINQLHLSNSSKNKNIKNNKKYIDVQKDKDVETSFKKTLKIETKQDLNIKKIINGKKNSPNKYSAYLALNNKQSRINNYNKNYKKNYRDNNLYTPKNERKISNANINDINKIKNNTIYFCKSTKDMINNYKNKILNKCIYQKNNASYKIKLYLIILIT